ncbi:MAG: DUF3160 domain-containing protein [Planctomycetes bacterium]|nr:DUF3160 domain-containing protein [Planctomycetota bacterium]
MRSLPGVVLLLATAPLPAQEPAWKAEARRLGLDEVEIAQLERDGLVVGRQSYDDPSRAYMDFEVPFFVTSDLVLFAYGRLLEDYMRPSELTFARILRKALQRSWGCLPSREARVDPELASAWPRCRRILAVALRLLGEDIELIAEDREPVSELVAAIERAEGTATPDWLGPYDGGFRYIDLDRFRCNGIYAGDEELERLYRAARWLQLVPFRVRRDDEMQAFQLLRRADAWFPGRIWRQWDHIVGAPDVWHADWLGDEDGSGSLESLRARIDARRAEFPRKATLDLPHDPDVKLQDEEGFRWLPSAPLPEGRLLHALGHQGPLPRVPSMLDLSAALGSPLARELLGNERSHFITASSKDLLTGTSIYGSTLAAIACLVDAPEADAPPLFHSEPWRRKSLAASLAGWMQARSVFSRLGDRAAGFAGSTEHVGFVEPEPRFFEALSECCATIANAGRVEERGVSDSTKSIRPKAVLLAEILRRLEGLADQQLRGRELSRSDRDFFFSLGITLYNLSDSDGEVGSARATEVVRDLVLDRSIVAGTGRPRALWLLYPWKGELVLCRGAVLPVYEVQTPQTPTHAEWNRRVNDGAELELPSWLKPIYAHGR